MIPAAFGLALLALTLVVLTGCLARAREVGRAARYPRRQEVTGGVLEATRPLTDAEWSRLVAAWDQARAAHEGQP